MRSNAKHTVLEKLRATLGLLRKSNVLCESSIRGVSALSLLKELQSELRNSIDVPLDSVRLIAPFICILKSQTVAGPYILAAIDSLQAFISYDVFLESPISTTFVLTEIVDSIIRCRFIPTDSVGDDVVQLRMIEVLQCIIANKCSAYLSELSCWDIHEFCCNILQDTGGYGGAVLLYQAAERTLQNLLAYLLACSIKVKDASLNNININNTALASDSVAGTSNTCLCKVLDYYITVVKIRANYYSAPAVLNTTNSDKNNKSSSTSAVNSSTTTAATRTLGQASSAFSSSASTTTIPSTRRRLSSASSSSLSSLSTPTAIPQIQYQQQLLISEVSYDPETLHLLFSLKMLSMLLLTNSEEAVRKLMTSCKEFSALLTDDLGMALLALSSARYIMYPNTILQQVLNVFSSLLNSAAAPNLRILIECFIRQVYIKALMQAYDMFSTQVTDIANTGGISPFLKATAPLSNNSNTTAAGNIDSSNNATSALNSSSCYRMDELEIIFESLCDITASPILLPALFVTFDCDPTSIDIVQPLVQYVCRCCCLVLTFSSDLMLGTSKEASILVTQTFKQILKTFVWRSDMRDKSLSNSSSSNSTELVAPATQQHPSMHSTGRDRSLTMLVQVVRAARNSKQLLSEASRLFVESPERGLRYLQQCGALPTPLIPETVANFLRLAPQLPKEAVGAFLGELGKEPSTGTSSSYYEAHSKEFHNEMLLKYVESFEFHGQSVLDCLRIFLSAFRLPGEAQQIDRILVAFSEHCFSQCMEKQSEVIENAEITYILTFSIIMLNTDRHNPNIRADRRMTKEQFVRNNKNYGRDAHQTVHLTVEYLEGIFDSIDTFPIRTEGSLDPSASVTTEVWKDLQMQAKVDAKRAVFVTTSEQHMGVLCDMLLHQQREDNSDDNSSNNHQQSTTVPSSSSLRKFLTEEWSTISSSNIHNSSGTTEPVGAPTGPTAFIAMKLFSAKSQSGQVDEQQQQHPSKITKSSFHSTMLLDPVELSLELIGHHWLFDKDLVQCIWQCLLRVCVCVHVHHSLVMRYTTGQQQQQQLLNQDGMHASAAATSAAADKGPILLKQGQLRRLLDVSNEFMMDYLKISINNGLDFTLHGVVATLVMCSGVMPAAPCNKLLSFLAWDDNNSNNNNKYPSSITSQDKISSDQVLLMVDSVLMLHQFRHYESARSSAAALLTVIQKYQSALFQSPLIWYFLGALRDCALLPKEMVLEAETDLLPPNLRNQFEQQLSEIDHKNMLETRPVPPKRAQRQQSSSSLLSLQGLGEALFGTSSSYNDESDDEEGGADNYISSGGNSGTSYSDKSNYSSNSNPVISAEQQEKKHRENVAEFNLIFKLNTLSGRWDAGYESNHTTAINSLSGSSSSSSSSTGAGHPSYAAVAAAAANRTSSNSSNNGSVSLDVKTTVPAYAIVDGGVTIESLRALFAKSGITQLISDTRYLSEEQLEGCLRTLVSIVEVKDESLSNDISGSWSSGSSMMMQDMPHLEPTAHNSSSTGPANSLSGSSSISCNSGSDKLFDAAGQAIARFRGLFNDCQKTICTNKHSFSSSTIAWLEMVLVEVSLRNRDRFHVFWAVLKHHYIRVLSGPSVKLSYITERRVLGLLKICTRMISRDNFSGTILELLGRLFARSSVNRNSSNNNSIKASNNGAAAASASYDDDEDSYNGNNSSNNNNDSVSRNNMKMTFLPIKSSLLLQLSNQISAGMWRVLTLNVELLPLLPLDQWQTLFTIIAMSGAAGSFAAIKSFESMAWLLHEPRLIAKVPVFCIIGVKPLLSNVLAPLSVSIGAVHLLTHLHSRLEVLIKDEPESEDYVNCEFTSNADGTCDGIDNVDDDSSDDDEEDSNTPVLWESCWIPILTALADGIKDSRVAVREACAEALCQAIRDRHAQAVPAGVLMDILGSIVSPMIMQLRDHVVTAINEAVILATLPVAATSNTDTPASSSSSSFYLFLTSKQIQDTIHQQWTRIETTDVPPLAAATNSSDDEDESRDHREDLSTVAASTTDSLLFLLTAPLSHKNTATEPTAIVSVLMECWASLCKSFLQHLKKLCSYPTFDKLWLKLLNVIGHFIDSTFHSAEAFSSALQVWDRLSDETKHILQDLYMVQESCKEHLKTMLHALHVDGVFRSRPGLLTVTKETVKQFYGYNTEIAVELVVDTITTTAE